MGRGAGGLLRRLPANPGSPRRAGGQLDRDPADANCIALGDAGFNPANPEVFPSNFPSEFFYSIADSDVMPTSEVVAYISGLPDGLFDLPSGKGP